MGSVKAKPVGSRISRSHISIIPAGLNYSALFSVISDFRSGFTLIALASAALPFLIIFYSPFPSSLAFFLFDAIPRLWIYSSGQLFTPRNLFLVLNLIILTIFAMAHLHPAAQPATAAVGDNNSSPQQHPVHDNHIHETSEEAAVRSLHSISTEIAWNDQASPDLSEMESTSEQLMNDLNTAHQDWHTDHKNDDIGGRLVIEDVIHGDNLQLVAIDNNEHQYRADHHVDCKLKRKKADKESRKAEKAKLRREGAVGQCARQPIGGAEAESKKVETTISTQGTEADRIDVLLTEEGSIFTRVQSRPLPSARFTHKKSAKQSGVDRPLSPMKLSRPILKRGETLEATWKAICESKRHSSPLTRHGHYARKRDSSGEMLEEILMHSLHKHDQLARAASPLTRRESSMAQEELNAKVEAFISRFNERIRIQRENSLRDYMEMVGRGAN